MSCFCTTFDSSLISLCHYVDLIEGVYGPIDGIALAVIERQPAEELVAKSAQKDLPVVTFDTDAPNSKRLAYIGTDNVAMGKELGRVLLQINSTGGEFGIIRSYGSNLQHRIDGVREALSTSRWTEVTNSPMDCGGNWTLAAQQMFELVNTNPDIRAIIPVGGWPMRVETAWKDFVDKNMEVITVVGDASEAQIALMNMGYANALVGQLPFEMGTLSIEKLLEVRQSQEKGLELPFVNEMFSTSFLDIINIPQNLPPMKVNFNYLENWVILGYTMFAIIALLSLGFAAFTFLKRKHPTIRKSQPSFLLMLSAGTLVVASSLIPLTFDNKRYSMSACSKACMSFPWLISFGFVTVFSALFSKIWRVNKILNNPNKFSKIKVTEKNVIAPCAVLLIVNTITLICWTVINPLKYEVKASRGTDNWNRVYKSFYGACQSSKDTAGGSVPYLIILSVANVIPVIIANVQAYHARFISDEFQESKYVALATACILQVIIIGTPVVLLLQEQPRAMFIVTTIVISITCTAVLLLIFVPKVQCLREYDANKREGHNAGAEVCVTGMNNPQSEGKGSVLKYRVMTHGGPDSDVSQENQEESKTEM